jgi:hypothetical protein
MTDRTHLNELISSITKPLSRKLVETFRECARDPSMSKVDHAQLLKNAMEADLLEDQNDAAAQSGNP